MVESLNRSQQADVSDEFLKDLRQRANSWVLCACGNQCAIIPREPDGSPSDFGLRSEGLSFAAYVGRHDWKRAARSLHKIEAMAVDHIREIEAFMSSELSDIHPDILENMNQQDTKEQFAEQLGQMSDAQLRATRIEKIKVIEFMEQRITRDEESKTPGAPVALIETLIGTLQRGLEAQQGYLKQIDLELASRGSNESYAGF